MVLALPRQLARNFFENLRRVIRTAVVAVTNCHLFECSIALCLTGVPVQAFPVVTENLAQRVCRGKRYTNAKIAIAAGQFWLDQVVLMAVVH